VQSCGQYTVYFSVLVENIYHEDTCSAEDSSDLPWFPLFGWAKDKKRLETSLLFYSLKKKFVVNIEIKPTYLYIYNCFLRNTDAAQFSLVYHSSFEKKIDLSVFCFVLFCFFFQYTIINHLA